MDKLKYIKLENEDGSYSSSIPLAVGSDYVDVKGNTLTSELSNKASVTKVDEEVSNLQSQINSLGNGSPLVANSVSEMTNTSKTYVNTTDGKWYYYDGSIWKIGGTYQSTQLGEKEVHYNNLSNVLQNENYIKLHAEDLIWKKGINYYNGLLNIDQTCMSSTPFILPKGNEINISNDFKVRITYFDINYNYINNTGEYNTQSSPWVYNDDCIVIISLGSNTFNLNINENDVTNDKIQFTGLIDKKSYSLGKSLIEFTQFEDTRMFLSNPFFLEKGSKIGLKNNLLKINNASQDGTMYFNVQEENIYKDMGLQTAFKKGYYTVNQSGMVRLAIGFVNSTDIQNGYLNKISSFIDVIEYNYFPNDELLINYSSGNAKIDYKYDNGNLLLNISQDFIIHKRGKTLIQITPLLLQQTFPNNIQMINNEAYFKIPSNQMLYYDLFNKNLKMSSITTTAEYTIYGNNTLPLAINKWENFCGGIILDYILKQKSENLLYDYDIFNSHAYNSFDYVSILKDFSKLYKNKNNIDTYLFFTDQHLLHTFDYDIIENDLINLLNPLEKIYNSLPLEYIVSGGDWLNSGDSQDIACYKLSYCTGFLYSKFKNFYPVLGNHDTNYQGKLNPDSELYTGILDNETLNNILFPYSTKNYYSFKGKRNINYVLDTQTDWDFEMNDYLWEQINWLGNKLIEDNPKHSTIFLHIVWNEPPTPVSLIDPLTKLLNAFNNHTSITLNNVNYNFTNNTGHVDYIMSGHTHTDFNATYNNILCVATTNFNQNGGTYDIVMNDYDNNKLILYRVGNGNSREFDI